MFCHPAVVTYDLEPAKLSPGLHVIGLELGQGFCGGSFGKAAGEGHTRAALLKLTLHSNVREQPNSAMWMLVSDASWAISAGGPVLWDSTYYGEDYDARLETVCRARSSEIADFNILLTRSCGVLG
eukprot:SAG31_NODE_1508_length_8063_cov_3.156956_5_plen_126_part_00